MRRARLQYFLSTLFLYGIGLAIYSQLEYYHGLITQPTLSSASVPAALQGGLIFIEALLGNSPYSVIVHLFLWALLLTWIRVIRRDFSAEMLREHRPYLFWKGLGTLLRRNLPFIKSATQPAPSLELPKEEAVTLRYYLVKFFFLPLMLTYIFGNFQDFSSRVWGTQPVLTGTDKVIAIYLLVFSACLLVDTAYFTVGYIFEFKKYSKVRSVDPTLFGWIVTLCCYPPFNTTTTAILGWGSQDTARYGSTTFTAIVLGIVGVLFVIYAASSVALGLRASNLTNRGIVSSGPYAIVRHPAYMTKNLGWIILGLPLVGFHYSATTIIGANWNVLFALLAWAFVYYLRALTEERHLLADPEYQAYCKKVRYRFIPGVY